MHDLVTDKPVGIKRTTHQQCNSDGIATLNVTRPPVSASWDGGPGHIVTASSKGGAGGRGTGPIRQ